MSKATALHESSNETQPRLDRRPEWLTPGFLIPSTVLAVLALAAIFAPVLAPADPTTSALADSLQPPFWIEGGSVAHPLGTDLFGRDILSRVIFGARVSLGVAMLVIVIGGTIGTVLGILAGFHGRWLDITFMRGVDIVLAFPPILLAIVLAVIYGPSYTNLVLVISLFIWPLVARQIRGETLALRGQDFVTYAESTGVPSWRLMFRHIAPNILPTLLVVLTLEVGRVILLEASLSYLGAGVPPPDPSWGLMVAEGQGRLATGWWISLFPGLAILLTVLSFNLLGDWLRDHFDPRLLE